MADANQGPLAELGVGAVIAAALTQHINASANVLAGCWAINNISVNGTTFSFFVMFLDSTICE